MPMIFVDPDTRVVPYAEAIVEAAVVADAVAVIAERDATIVTRDATIVDLLAQIDALENP